MKIHLDETRASCSPSQSKCCQKPRAASAKCRVFPVYLIIFSPKRKDVLSVSLQCSHQLFSITPDPEQREESRVFLVSSDYLYLMEKDAASVFSRNINRSEKPRSQSSNLLVKTNFLLERSAVIEDEGDYQFSSSKFLPLTVFLRIRKYVRKKENAHSHNSTTKPETKAVVIML